MNKRVITRLFSLILAGLLFLESPVQTYAEQAADAAEAAEETEAPENIPGQEAGSKEESPGVPEEETPPGTPEEEMPGEPEEGTPGEEPPGGPEAPEPGTEEPVIVLKKIELRAEVVSYKLIKLTWDKCEGATGYRISRKDNDSGFRLLKTIASGDTLEYRDSGLIPGCNYEYRIRPIRQEGDAVFEGGESDAVSLQARLAAPVIGAVKCIDYQTLEVSWKSVGGAAGYEVFRSDSEEGEYQFAARVAGGVSYQSRGLVLGKTYYYKVRSYGLVNGEKVYGELSQAKDGKTFLPRISGLKAAAEDYETIKLTWDKVGAQKYQIYYAEKDETSVYRFLSAVSGSSYQFKNAVCGRKYYFKVRAVCTAGGKTEFGEYSSVVSGEATLETLSLKITEQNYNRILMQWDAVPGAEYYEVHIFRPEDEETGSVTITDTSFTHGDLNLGETYYYRVDAIRQECTRQSRVVSGTTRLGALTGLKASRSGSKVNLSWNAVEGVTSYQILRAASADGTYEKRGTTSATSFRDSDVSTSKTYYYKVRGVRKEGEKEFYTEAGPVKVAAVKEFKGIDVSAYQGNIDWGKVAGDGIDFAMIRIVTGKSSSFSTKDTKFEANYTGAVNNGVKVGVYRYSYATTEAAAREEARKVIDALDGRKLDYPVVMDVEDSSVLSGTGSNAKRSKIILAFKKEVEAAGYKFAIYANTNWLNNYLDMDMLSDCDIWLARWRDVSLGHGYTGKGRVTMWQYTDKGSVSGISGYVDRSISYKDY